MSINIIPAHKYYNKLIEDPTSTGKTNSAESTNSSDSENSAKSAGAHGEGECDEQEIKFMVTVKVVKYGIVYAIVPGMVLL